MNDELLKAAIDACIVMCGECTSPDGRRLDYYDVKNRLKAAVEAVQKAKVKE